MSNAKKKVQELIDKVEALNEELKKETATIFDYLFEKYPELGAVTFSGWVPYFNDGDECVFGLNEVFFIKKKYFDDDPLDNGVEQSSYVNVTPYDPDIPSEYLYKHPGSEHSWYVLSYLLKGLSATGGYAIEQKARWDSVPDEKKAEYIDAIEDFNLVSMIPENIWQMVGGSHFIMTATPGRVHYEEYTEHD